MANYATSEGFTFNMLMLKSFSLCDECSKLDVWEESTCSKKLNNLRNYKDNLLTFNFEDEYEIKQKDGMIKDLSAMITKLETLKRGGY
ncbi:MAG: hypothetical protein NKF70_00430 [Methanobacterium sp. ERen5]|nr:MAG: hypothetical protein NKF70_00430 [Methanobacterium sp. ERen5]